MKLKNLWLIAVAILIYACNAEETRSWEVTFDPNKPKDPNEQSIINVAAGKFYKMNVVANSAYADKAPLDPWTSGTKLTDEETGTLSTKNRGVGWDAQTVEVIIDLGSLRSITEVSVHAISDPTSQIVFPAQIEVSTSKDKSQWEKAASPISYSDSNGNVVSNPKYLEKSMRKLMREQRKLSRKEKGSKNRNKQRVKVALVHEKITNQRNDFLQNESTKLIRENQTICIEDLKVKNMMRNHKLAQHIGSASWSKFFDMLTYKSVWYGNDIVKVPTMYPSSQTCSCCGFKNPLVKNLAIRKWECPECHTKHDRDTNASINILNKGLQMQSA